MRDTPWAGAAAPDAVVCIFAHNEEKRIADCIAALPVDNPAIKFFVIENGSSDQTSEVARRAFGTRENCHVLCAPSGGKARAWNYFVHERAPRQAGCYVFTDGDCRIAPGSIEALASALAGTGEASSAHPNAACAAPRTGRSADRYRIETARRRAVFGGLYALSGDFVRRLIAENRRMPEDLIGDDGLVESWAKTNLGVDRDWNDNRIAYVPDAGFFTEARSAWSPSALSEQFGRMIRYSERRLQNLVVTDHYAGDTADDLPPRLAPLVRARASWSQIRLHPVYFLPDVVALVRTRRLR